MRAHLGTDEEVLQVLCKAHAAATIEVHNGAVGPKLRCRARVHLDGEQIDSLAHQTRAARRDHVRRLVVSLYDWLSLSLSLRLLLRVVEREKAPLRPTPNLVSDAPRSNLATLPW